MRTYSETELLNAYDAAPIAVQESLSGGAGLDFMMSMQNRYGLHVDVVGEISGYIRNLLLGLLPPTDFFQALLDLHLDSSSAQKMTADLNNEVFIPLRDVMKLSKSSRIPSTPAAKIEKVEQPVQSSLRTPTPVSIPSIKPVAPDPKLDLHPSIVATETHLVSVPTPPKEESPSVSVLNRTPVQPIIQKASDLPQAPTTLPGSPEPAPMPEVATSVAPAVEIPPTWVTPIPKSETQSVVTPTSPTPEVSHPQMRTMAKDMELLKKGINPLAETTAPAPAPEPSRAFMQESYEPVPLTPKEPADLAFKPLPKRLSAPVAGSYGTDPYREPI